MDWQSIKTAPTETPVKLLYAFPDGERAVEGVYRRGTFWSREVDGWWAPEGGMWVDGWIKGWHPV